MRCITMFALWAVALIACSPAERLPPVIVVDAPAPAPALVVAAPSSRTDDTCAAVIEVQQVAANRPTCFVDARVRNEAGELRFPCEGGDAEARFAGAHFLGRASGDEVDVTLQTTFDFEDGCRWVSEQRIRGSLSANELDYTYTEAPAPGQSGCTSPCAARAKVAVSRRSHDG